MPSWTLVDTHPTQGRTFQRPLDLLEQWLFWNGLLNGGTDGVQYCKIRLLNGSRDAYLFSDANIMKAWLSIKRRHLLTGAAVRGADLAPLRLNMTTDLNAGNGTGFTSEPHFVVREQDLAVLRPHELVFGIVESAEEAQRRMASFMNGPRLLSGEQLMRLYAFRETSPKRADVLHLMVMAAHCVTDRAGLATTSRCLLDTLARGTAPAQCPLEERLAMATASMDSGLEPKHLRSLSPAIRRWRRAVGILIFRSRLVKRQGGHTLPCRLTRSTPTVAAKSGLVTSSLTHTQSATVVENCRLHGVTFGNAYLALAQVAMTRLLYRRYRRGEISEEEWAYRKRQPCTGWGPLSLRRHLDKEWFEKGGGGESMMSIGLFFFELPFMTLGETEGRPQCVLSDGAPPFSNLLTFDRFLHRAGLVKRQATSSRHPLFFDILHAAIMDEMEHERLGALQWMKRAEATGDQAVHETTDDEVLAVTDIPMICAFGGSTAGNLDLMSPTKYPLPSTHPLSPYSSASHPIKAGYVNPPLPASTSEVETAPTVIVENSMIHMRSRPADLYLSADSMDGQINMYVFYDGNVYDEGVVREWLDEVKAAVLWYLCQTHQSRHTRQRRSGDGQVGRGKSIQVKL